MCEDKDIQNVLKFWFDEIDPQEWWKEDNEKLDALIKEKFLGLHKKAKRNELYSWRNHANGALAEIIILDQFSRNIYRGHPESFSNDPLALALAMTAVEKGFDKEFPTDKDKRSFLYLPYMHSESKIIHDVAVMLYRQLGNEKKLKIELEHKSKIDCFGRYPHRNKALGRVSTDKELEFLNIKSPDEKRKFLEKCCSGF